MKSKMSADSSTSGNNARNSLLSLSPYVSADGYMSQDQMHINASQYIKNSSASNPSSASNQTEDEEEMMMNERMNDRMNNVNVSVNDDDIIDGNLNVDKIISRAHLPASNLAWGEVHPTPHEPHYNAPVPPSPPGPPTIPTVGGKGSGIRQQGRHHFGSDKLQDHPDRGNAYASITSKPFLPPAIYLQQDPRDMYRFQMTARNSGRATSIIGELCMYTSCVCTIHTSLHANTLYTTCAYPLLDLIYTLYTPYMHLICTLYTPYIHLIDTMYTYVYTLIFTYMYD